MGFSFKSSYESIHNSNQVSTPLDVNKEKLFKILWAYNIPSNILFFGWKTFLGILQTRDELVKRGISSGQHKLVFPLYFGLEESHAHLFLRFLVASTVWRIIMEWLNLNLDVFFVCLEDHLLH